MAPKKDKNFGVQGKEGGMGGKYARKATNLSASELKKAGASKAAAARKVDITQTTRAYGTGKTLGPAGKPLTGTVKMGDGTTAVYKNGVRVRKAAASSPSRGGGNGTGNGTGNGNNMGKPLSLAERKTAATKAANTKVGKDSATELAKRKSSAMPALSYKKPGTTQSTPTPSSGGSNSVKFEINQIKQKIKQNEQRIAMRAAQARIDARKRQEAGKSTAAQLKKMEESAAATKRDKEELARLKTQLDKYGK